MFRNSKRKIVLVALLFLLTFGSIGYAFSTYVNSYLSVKVGSSYQNKYVYYESHLSVYPQSTLNLGNTTLGSLSYPSTNVGRTTIGGADNYLGVGDMKAYQWTSSGAGYVTGVTFHVNSFVSGAKARTGVYNGSSAPASLIAGGDEVTITTTGWVTDTFATPVYIAAGVWWISILDEHSSQGFRLAVDTGTGTQKYSASGYDVMPVTWPTGSGNSYGDSVYMTIQESQAGTDKCTHFISPNSQVNVTSFHFYAFNSGHFWLSLYSGSSVTPINKMWDSGSTIVVLPPSWQTVSTLMGSPTLLIIQPSTDLWSCWQVDSGTIPAYLSGSSNSGTQVTSSYNGFPTLWSGGGTPTSENWSDYMTGYNYTVLPKWKLTPLANYTFDKIDFADSMTVRFNITDTYGSLPGNQFSVKAWNTTDDGYPKINLIVPIKPTVVLNALNYSWSSGTLSIVGQQANKTVTVDFNALGASFLIRNATGPLTSVSYSPQFLTIHGAGNITVYSPVLGGSPHSVTYNGVLSSSWSYNNMTDLFTLTGSSSPATWVLAWTYPITMNLNGYGVSNPANGTAESAGISIGCHISGDSSNSSTVRRFYDGVIGTGLGSYTGSANPFIVTVNGPITESVLWTTQYNVTVATSGIGSDAPGTVVILNGTAKTEAQLPYWAWVTSGNKLNYAFSSLVAGTIYGYTWGSMGGFSQTLSSNIFTVSSSGTLTGIYIRGGTFGSGGSVQTLQSTTTATTNSLNGNQSLGTQANSGLPSWLTLSLSIVSLPLLAVGVIIIIASILEEEDRWAMLGVIWAAVGVVLLLMFSQFWLSTVSVIASWL